ncbi:MAG: DUF2155 domain-containing protein [Rickettsiaceae bacterium]|nr:DUF2155 domain-containing protein [Rickettsiaceae bacterium]
MRLKFFYINLVFFSSLMLVSASFADDLDIQDVEEALGVKTKNTCTTPPCPVDSDLVLDNVTNAHSQKRENINSVEKNKKIEEKKNSGFVGMDRAELIILNKITAKSQKVVFSIGEVKFFGNISVEVHKCTKNTDPFNANNLMLITVFDNKIPDENLSVFHGWVMSSNPSLSTVEHPVYEVLPVKCLPAAEPEQN